MTTIIKDLLRIKNNIIQNKYAYSTHAEKEMQDDFLNEIEIEQAILNSNVIRTQKDNLNRTVYTLEGITNNFRRVRAICRFSDSGEYVIIITVYEVI